MKTATCFLVFGLAIGLAQGPGGPAFQAMVKDAKSRIQEINVEQLKTMQGSGSKFMFVDVREDDEWRAGHAEGAVHISKGLLEREIEGKAPAKDQKIVLYCGGGSRSALAADALPKMGYTNVVSLAGGLGAYKQAGLKVEE